MTQGSQPPLSLSTPPNDRENDTAYRMKVETEEDQSSSNSVVKRQVVPPLSQQKKLLTSISNGDGTTSSSSSLTSNVTKITKSTAAIGNAPIWRHYLSERTQKTIEMTTTTSEFLRRPNIKLRSKKRARGNGNNVMDSISLSEWGSDKTLSRIRGYWEQLSALERQQVLFLDEPELVKQLYKLNLSLLCVGLMQRHLKNPAKSSSSNSSITQRLQTKTQSTSSSEKTYELLEAMEFMDIGTGILTVKSDLVEQPARLFDLVSGVLFGFLSTLHLLDEKEFLELFVNESEVISSWDEYQMLIAMLLEQLILKSYMLHLEKAAILQMEQLLLEEMVEQKASNNSSKKSTASSSSTSTNQKKKKKKKKKKCKKNQKKIAATTTAVEVPVEELVYPRRVSNMSQEEMTETSTVSCGDLDEDDVDEDDKEELENHKENDDTEGETEMEPCPDPDLESPVLKPERNNMEEMSSDLITPVDTMTPTKSFLLNPNASVFEPTSYSSQRSREAGMVATSAPSAPLGKRKLDDFIINLSKQDLVFEEDEEECQYQDFTTKRIREEDAELEENLKKIYRSTSNMLGWDCLKNCEVTTNSSFGRQHPEWDENILMMTAPKQVVRHFTPPKFTDGKNTVDTDYTITQEMKGWVGAPPSRTVPPHSRYYYHPNMLTSMSDLPSFVPLETGSFRMTDRAKTSTHHGLHHTPLHPSSSSHRTVRSPVPMLYPFPDQFEPVVKSLPDFPMESSILLQDHSATTEQRHFSVSTKMNRHRHHHHASATCGGSSEATLD